MVKSQIPSTKIQINSKFQYSISKIIPSLAVHHFPNQGPTAMIQQVYNHCRCIGLEFRIWVIGIYIVAENLVLWARSEFLGYAVNLLQAGTE
ncbi:hypothetical protein D1AOALGA4SA_8225 [Olavius algarvensis Delta 1 endosymbiont]|nr:hypothetical protein D1AOALGA4SA_8225 [Olavius algarvensis Delta 1 endosymbiont]